MQGASQTANEYSGQEYWVQLCATAGPPPTKAAKVFVILKGRNQVHSNEIPFVDFLLLGGGLASATAAETLRAAGPRGLLRNDGWVKPTRQRTDFS